MLATLVAAAIVTQGTTPSFYASSNRWGYSGTVAVYETLADAQAERNPRGSVHIFPQRDGSLFIVRNRSAVHEDFNGILTNWYPNGGQTPSNVDEGFFQMYDGNLANWPNQRGAWSADHKNFTISTSGKDPVYPATTEPGDHARLWNAGGTPVTAEASRGVFVRYEYTFTAQGVDGEDPDGDGFFTSTKNATGYTGSFTGIFKNESKTSPESNGFYVFKLTINSTSWAAANGFAREDRYGSSAVR